MRRTAKAGQRSVFRSRFFWKMYGGYVVVVFIFALIVGVTVTDWVSRESAEQIRLSLRDKSTLLGALSEDVLRRAESGGQETALQQRVRSLGIQLETRLTVIDKNGVVLADSEEDPARMNNHIGREEIVTAARDGSGFATRLSATVRREMMYHALRVGEPGNGKGFVRAALSLEMVDDQISTVRGFVILGAGVAGLIGLLIGGFFAGRVTSRIESLTEMSLAVTQGDYSQRIAVNTQDEIGKLGASFNSMAEQMEERILSITKDRNTVKAVLRSMIEGVVAVDTSECVLHMNAVAGDILEVDPDEVIGARVWEVARVNEIARSLGASLSGERVYQTQARIMRGEIECLLEITSTPLTDGDGGVAGAVVVFHDVTEMRRLESVRREFVVNASHELKTPITAIRGFLDTLNADADMPSETRESFIRRAALQAERLANLVTDLLRLSSFEAGVEADEVERVDLRTVVQNSVRGLFGVAGEKDIELDVGVSDDEVPVMGDQRSLGLVVDNLIDNAIKYTPRGGHVNARVFLDGGQAIFEVQDDGIGMERADLDRIFERFYRVDKVRSREAGGTGLGLAIVKHACSVLGGEIEVESEPGVGSTFRVTLPTEE